MKAQGTTGRNRQMSWLWTKLARKRLVTLLPYPLLNQSNRESIRSICCLPRFLSLHGEEKTHTLAFSGDFYQNIYVGPYQVDASERLFVPFSEPLGMLRPTRSLMRRLSLYCNVGLCKRFVATGVVQ
jgi:hypothetical protein